jgi:hypothetical protein
MRDDPTASTGGAAPPTEGGAPSAPPAERAASSSARDADLVLAGVHLRLGSLALARAELETLAGRDALDPEGILDLAEVRWRTGDTEGAGEAAAVVLDDEDGPLVALIVAAEAAAARGRPTEARRLAAKALAAANGSIDRIFAGMPRSAAWPPDPAAPPPAPTTMFDPAPGSAAARGRGRQQPRRAPAAVRPPVEPAADEGVQAAALGDETIGLWGDETDAPGPADAALPSASEALERGREALENGDLQEASIHLALVLRLSSPMAPAVLDVVADRAEPELAFVRGDAYRLVGRELDARRAYARARSPVAPAGVATEAGASETSFERMDYPEMDRSGGMGEPEDMDDPEEMDESEQMDDPKEGDRA